MLYRTFGKTGERVSILGFGCMRLPTIGGDEGKIDNEEATRMLHFAIDSGVNYVDNAYVYHQGNSEPWLGEALAGGYREKVLLATKLWPSSAGSREDCERLLDEQLRRLRTDRIDFYLLHSVLKTSWGRLKGIGVLDFLDAALVAGKIRYTGFSFHDDPQTFREVVDSYDWSMCLMQYNFMDERYQAGRGGLEYAAGRGLGVAVMEPLRGGFLAGNVPPEVRAIWDSAEKRRTPAEWALRWVWNQPEVSVALSGMSAMDHVRENARVASEATAGSLASEELETIGAVRDWYRRRVRIDCTLCYYCMPCPEGVNIPKIFSLYNNIFVFETDRMQKLYYNNFMDRSEWPTKCIECGKCQEACPQGIEIIEMLKACHEQLVNDT